MITKTRALIGLVGLLAAHGAASVAIAADKPPVLEPTSDSKATAVAGVAALVVLVMGFLPAHRKKKDAAEF
jgi:hypothetical protein